MVTLMNITVRRRKYLVVNPFKEHPNSVGETYLQHMIKALKFSIRLELLSVVCLVHSIFPFWYTTRTSDGVRKLLYEMKLKEKRNDRRR